MVNTPLCIKYTLEKKSKDLSRMNSPETLETLGTQDTGRRQKNNKTHTHTQRKFKTTTTTNPTKNRG